MKKLKARITMTEEMLGMSPDDKEIYDTYISTRKSKCSVDNADGDPEVESDSIDEDEIKGRTVWPKLDDGTPFFWNYQIKGFFKDACGMLARIVEKDENGKKKKGLTHSARLSSYKKVIDGNIFVFPRKIPIIIPEGGESDWCQRPLRAQTAQGERIALACSETVPAGSYIEIEIKLLSDDLEDVVMEWLDYGELRGLGQWRNSGKGTFEYEIIPPESESKKKKDK